MVNEDIYPLLAGPTWRDYFQYRHLEAALLGLPAVVVYRLSITVFIFRGYEWGEDRELLVASRT